MLLEHSDFDSHEKVVFHCDASSGLNAFIAIHDTRLGPAIGGCRMVPYSTSYDALTDVLRLSRGMTYKCAIAGIPYGGGKAVIMADPDTEKTTSILHSMGDFVDSLVGQYITSFDSGTTLEDVKIIGERTQYVGGILEGAGNASASTARGVLITIERAAQIHLKTNSLKGVRVAIQGAGNVGARLAVLLSEAQAIVTISDVNVDKAQAVAVEIGASVEDAEHIHEIETDIFAPCAMGGVISDLTIPNMRASIVAGGANNQLAESRHAAALQSAGILYCPDYLANAGGIIDLHYQRSGGSKRALADHLLNIGDTLEKIVLEASCSGQTTLDVVDQFVQSKLENAGRGSC